MHWDFSRHKRLRQVHGNRVYFVTSKLTSFLTELTDSMLTRRRSLADIASDCQGSIKTMKKARAGRRPKWSPKEAQGHITAAYVHQTVRDRGSVIEAMMVEGTLSSTRTRVAGGLPMTMP